MISESDGRPPDGVPRLEYLYGQMLYFIYHKLGRTPTTTLVVPDFEAMNRHEDQATITFCRLAMWICLKSANRDECVTQTVHLPVEYQGHVMRIVHLVRDRFTSQTKVNQRY